MDLNSLMSLSEAGVVIGVVLEGTEYVSPIHKRWPILERIGFLVLVLSLVADWHFQSAINQQQTQSLLAADKQIAELHEKLIAVAPRSWIINDAAAADRMVAKLKPFAGQKVFLYRSHLEDSEEIRFFALGIDGILAKAGWLGPEGSPIFLKDKPQSSYKNFADNTTPVREGLPFVLIEFDQSAPQKVKNAGIALAETLDAENLRATTFRDGSPMKPPLAHGDVLAVTVGRRPFF